MIKGKFEDYVSRAHEEVRIRLKNDEEVEIEKFTSPIVSKPPRRLVKGSKNRVLIYKGWFNPPHRGHEALISHIERCTEHMNVVGTMIIPIGDPTGDWGWGKTPPQICVKDRVALMRREWDKPLPHWRWVFDMGNGEYYYDFLRCLKKETWRDGYNLEYLKVMGTDWIGEPNNSQLFGGCRITSDVSRTDALFLGQGDGRLQQLEGCSPWALLHPITTVADQEDATSSLWTIGGRSLFSENDNDRPTWADVTRTYDPNNEYDAETMRLVAAIQICDVLLEEGADSDLFEPGTEGSDSGYPKPPEDKITVYFVPRVADYNDCTKVSEISSTYIRELMLNTNRQNHQCNMDKLRKLALSPEMLMNDVLRRVLAKHRANKRKWDEWEDDPCDISREFWAMFGKQMEDERLEQQVLAYLEAAGEFSAMLEMQGKDEDTEVVGGD